jgi:hypothetical protein
LTPQEIKIPTLSRQRAAGQGWGTRAVLTHLYFTLYFCACPATAIQSFHQPLGNSCWGAIGVRQAVGRGISGVSPTDRLDFPNSKSCSVSVTQKEFLNKTINLRYYSPVLTESHISAPL